MYGYNLHYIFNWCGVSNNVEGVDDVSNYKIIGNIYDNSELLKKERKEG